MTRTTVGVLRGGTSSEYPLSLKTGAAILQALPEDKYETRDILVDKNGLWHLRGMPVTPARALAQLDVVLNAIHGGVGEDGSVQRMLDRAGVPYAGSRALPSNMSLNKARTYELLRKRGIPVPRGRTFNLEQEISAEDMAREIFQQFGPPYIVKPTNEGASNGVRYVATLIELPDAIADVLEAFGTAKVQEYLMGAEVSVGVIEDFRGEELYTLPPVHIIIPDGKFLRFEHHDQGLARHIVPSNFSDEEKQLFADIARTAHRALGLAHYSRADIMLTRSGAYLLEMNSVPGLYHGAAFPPALEAVGSSIREFVEHAIHLAQR